MSDPLLIYNEFNVILESVDLYLTRPKSKVQPMISWYKPKKKFVRFVDSYPPYLILKEKYTAHKQSLMIGI